MNQNRLVEYIFFFGTLGFAGYMVWRIFLPFISALALAAIIVVICYPLFEFFLKYVTKNNRSLAAILSTLVVFAGIVTPLFFASTLLVNEFIVFYKSLGTSSTPLGIDSMLVGIEQSLQQYIPGFDINIGEQLRQSLGWFTQNIGAIFAGTISLVLTFLIALIGSFYLFKDGERLTSWLVNVSPLKDTEDKIILRRISRSVRSVATGTVLVAIIQGVTAAIGFELFGIERSILWGAVAAFGALLPGIGTAGIMVPAVAYLFYVGNITGAIGLIIWASAAIIVIDNIISPYLMSRGNNLHPFVMLISVLGGITLFGPIGFILGPVFVSLFTVLLELYAIYMKPDNERQLFKRKN